jgi:hypothetical protein
MYGQLPAQASRIIEFDEVPEHFDGRRPPINLGRQKPKVFRKPFGRVPCRRPRSDCIECVADHGLYLVLSNRRD